MPSSSAVPQSPETKVASSYEKGQAAYDAMMLGYMLPRMLENLASLARPHGPIKLPASFEAWPTANCWQCCSLVAMEALRSLRIFEEPRRPWIFSQNVPQSGLPTRSAQRLRLDAELLPERVVQKA